MEGCCQEAVPVLAFNSAQGLNVALAHLSVPAASPSEWKRLRSQGQCVTKTFKMRAPGLRFCRSILCQYVEAHGGCEKLLKAFCQSSLCLSHSSLLQGLQFCALDPRDPLLHLWEASTSSQKSFLKGINSFFRGLLPAFYVPPELCSPKSSQRR